MNGWDRPKQVKTEFGGDGRRQRSALQDAYQPDGDTEGASMEGLLPRKKQEEKRRADGN